VNVLQNTERLFHRLMTIPDWASDFAGSWAQFFLKYLLADERVTMVIPGTSNAAHMADNLGHVRSAARSGSAQPDGGFHRRPVRCPAQQPDSLRGAQSSMVPG
jgi:aryl-alcohol dehydrogenase-like predicted oxidoreductase